jgi:hypothetical protein
MWLKDKAILIRTKDTELRTIVLVYGARYGMVTGYGLDGWRSIPGTDKRISFSPQHADLLWGPSSLIANGYRRFLPLTVKLTGDLLVPVKNYGAVSPFPHTSSWHGA